MESVSEEIGALREFIRRHRRLVVLTGAGISADSGIPTYRDRSGKWRHSKPVQHRDFLRHEGARRRAKHAPG